MAQRLNKPQVPTGSKDQKSIGMEWTLYQIDDTRYKLCSNVPISGKANYSLTVTNGRIDRKLDCGKLQNNHPFVFEDIERALGTVETLAGPDKYGDIALYRGSPLTADQKWQRKIMYIREKYLVQATAGIMTNIPLAVHSLYTPIYGEPPSDKVIAEVSAYVKRGELPTKDTLQGILRRYYGGEYKPRPLETLAVNLDIICEVF